MADDADLSDLNILAATERTIQQHRKKMSLKPRGRCHFCDEGVQGDARFCDTNCRDDYDRAEKAHKRNGR